MFVFSAFIFREAAKGKIKMTKLIFVRHGQSMANLENIFAGTYDVDLSPKGHMQAEKTAIYVAENYKIDKIYSSDLKRAYSTAKHIADRLDLDIITETGLREISAGQWEGMHFDDLEKNFPDEYSIWKNDIGKAVCPGGESVKHLGERVTNILSQIAEKNCGKTVLIATHATPIRVIECLWQNLSLDKMKDIPWVSNASVTTVEISNDAAYFLEIGIDEHLTDIKTELPANV